LIPPATSSARDVRGSPTDVRGRSRPGRRAQRRDQRQLPPGQRRARRTIWSRAIARRGLYRLSSGSDRRSREAWPTPVYADLDGRHVDPEPPAGQQFAEAIRRPFPNKLSPTPVNRRSTWKKNLDRLTIAKSSASRRDGLTSSSSSTLAGSSRAQRRMIRAGAQATRRTDGRILRARRPSSRPGERLHRHAPSARGRHRLLRQVPRVLSAAEPRRALHGSTEEAQF